MKRVGAVADADDRDADLAVVGAAPLRSASACRCVLMRTKSSSGGLGVANYARARSGYTPRLAAGARLRPRLRRSSPRTCQTRWHDGERGQRRHHVDRPAPAGRRRRSARPRRRRGRSRGSRPGPGASRARPCTRPRAPRRGRACRRPSASRAPRPRTPPRRRRRRGRRSSQATAVSTIPSSIRSRVESRKAPNRRALARHPRVAAVERVHDRADDERDAGEEEEPLGDEHGGGEVAARGPSSRSRSGSAATRSAGRAHRSGAPGAASRGRARRGRCAGWPALHRARASAQAATASPGRRAPRPLLGAGRGRAGARRPGPRAQATAAPAAASNQ